MAITFTLTLTDAQHKALAYVTSSPKDWIENVVYERCRISMEDIVSQEVQRITSIGGAISGTKEDIVLAAPILSAEERAAAELRTQI
jgi:hypothetical protein